MIKLLSRLRGRTFDELRVRSMQFTLAKLEQVNLAWQGPAHPSHRATRNARSQGFQSTNPHEIAKLISSRDPEVLRTFRTRTEMLFQGKVDILGLGFVHVGTPPNWHRDAISGHVAPHAHWSKIPYLDHNIVGDHKIVWEINRHQYLFAPALCWLSNQESQHFDLVQQHLESWMQENPPRIGVNWASSLEVAYRGITWCWLLWMLRDAPWKQGLLNRLYASLEAHAAHVERYLSLYFSPNTHLTGEALGLFYVGTLLPNSRNASRWRKRGAEILESWLDRQVHEDGVYFEQATQYHRYTTEIYLHYLLLGEASSWPISSRVRDALNRLFDVLRSIASCNGTIPLIGDDDGGLLLPVDQYPPEQVGGLLLAGATALNRPDLIAHGATHTSLSYWLCGIDKTNQMLARPPAIPAWTDLYFARGGLAIIRAGWREDSDVAVIDAAPHGAMNCGHAHADALSLTLSLGGEPLFIDRGTLTYVGAERNEFRSTASHNTLEIDMASSVTPLGPFQWGPIPPRPKASLLACNYFSAFSGTACGHVDTAHPSQHHRQVLHVHNSAWLVLDQATRTPTSRAICRWQLHPDLTTTQLNPATYAVHAANTQPLATITAAIANSFKHKRREASLRFGHHAPATVLEAEASPELRILTIIVPAHISGQLTQPETLKCDQARGWAWADPLGFHSVMVHGSEIPLMELAGWHSDADLLWHVRFGKVGPGDPTELLLAVNPRQLNVPGEHHRISQNRTAKRIVGLIRTATGWAELTLNEPRRGQE